MLAVVAATQHAWAEGGSAAQKKQMCEGCHGIADYRTAFPDVYNVPKLGGQGAAYIAKALHDYKSGARKHPTMIGIAATAARVAAPARANSRRLTSVMAPPARSTQPLSANNATRSRGAR